ncbi:hypothetical protein Dfri01_14260 [Dyadobacter frigoris]|nr:hypothetical protein Dfri01_14260 [Dyadobacter frigoris]
MSLNRPFDKGSELNYPCPECGKKMTLLPHRFRPPKKSEEKQWETIRFLIEKGFYFQHIYEKVETKNGVTSYKNYVAYPDNIRDAKEFVEKFKEQARKN